MPETILDRLRTRQLLQKVVLPEHVSVLLGAAQIQSPDDRQVKFAYTGGTGAFNLDLDLPDRPRDFRLTFKGPAAAPTGFTAAISLKEGPHAKVLALVPDAVGRALAPAQVKSAGDEQWLEPLGGTARTSLKGGDLWLVVIGEVGSIARLKLAPNAQGTDVVEFDLDPPAALFGGSGFGMSFPAGLALDMADDAVAPGKTRAGIPSKVVTTSADTPSWQGLVVREGKFFLPKGVPFLGGNACDASLQIGLSPEPGIALVLDARIDGTASRPPIDVHLECVDPTATGLSSVMPTLVQASMELPIERPQDAGGTSFKFLAGTPVRARARYARQPASDQYEFSLAIEAQGANGIAFVDGTDTASRAVTAAATLATSIMANDPTKKDLGKLLVAGVGLGSTFLKRGSFAVHRAEIAATGRPLPTETMSFRLDYSVATVIQTVGVGSMSLQMNPAQPLRMRVRDVELSFDRRKQGLAMFELDYQKSAMEIEDPGGWTTSNASLFDVLGTRPIVGSTGFEVDLGFRVNLGPVKVSGATIRFEIPGLKASLTGLAVSLDLKPLVGGSGSLQLLGPDKFKASLGVEILPLQVKAFGLVETNDRMVRIEIGVEFPGPLPLANSGLAIYGLGGSFVADGEPELPANYNPKQLLDWAKKPEYEPRTGQHTFGLRAIVGTAPDLGFSFSALAGLSISTPKVNVIASLEAGLLGERKSLLGGTSAPAVEATGVLAIAEDAISIAVHTSMELPMVGPKLIKIEVPVAARFPIGSDMRSWYLNLGADGYNGQGRELGPIRATLFPGVFDQRIDAYFMAHGNGLEKFPRGQGPSYTGTLTAFGFSLDITLGLEPIVWAEVWARADILLTMEPVAFIGQGQLGGSLNIGVFSVGVDATIDVAFVENNDPYIKAVVCGTVDLFFDEVRECVELKMNDTVKVEAGTPVCPLDHDWGHWLVDDQYRSLNNDPRKACRLSTARTNAPIVWPDAIPLLTFSTTPTIDPAIPTTTFKNINTLQGSLRQGNELLWYEWTLKDVRLKDVTKASAPTDVAGPLSCAWQLSKFGGTSGDGGTLELALLTHDKGIWVRAVVDQNGAPPREPLRVLTDLCRLDRPAALPGWAIGEFAQRQVDKWRLPPDPVSGDPLQSQVRATVWTSFARETPLSRTSELPSPELMYVDAHSVPIAGIDLHDRAFVKALAPVQLDVTPDAIRDRYGPQSLSVQFDEELQHPEVYLFVQKDELMRDWTGNPAAQGNDLSGQPWQTDEASASGAGWILRYRARRARQFVASVLPGTRFAVLGVWGTTKSAVDEAARREAQIEQEIADRQARKPNNGSKTTSATDRCVLEPGKTYCIEVDLEWVARTREKVTDAPNTGPANSVSRKYYFRTAKLRKGAISQISSVTEQHGVTYEQQTVFNPEMLERHLQGYSPGQSTLDWFRGDEVGAHFAVGHVAALAKVYGYTLGCAIRRLDRKEAWTPLTPSYEFPVSGAFFQGVEKAIAEAYVASPCGFPPPGIVIKGKASLEDRAWYEVYVTATRIGIGTARRARLKGASFRTSRWVGPEEMLAALNFPTSGTPGNARGDVELSRARKLATTRLGRDTEFEALLRDYGIDGWAPPNETRVSHLWLNVGGAWHWAGVYLESPEPIHRAGRFVTDDASGTALAIEGAAATIDVRGRDRSGCRLLYATTLPFQPPAGGAVARLACTDKPGTANTPRVGRLAIPARPRFA